MKPKGRRTVGTIIDWIGILLAGLNPVNLLVVGVEFVVIQLIINYFREEDKNGESDNKIREVDQCENLVVPNISKDANKKMFDHGFETVNCFCFLFPEFSETVPKS